MKSYTVNIRNTDLSELQKYISLCDERRKAAIAGYRFEADKKRSIVAGLLLRYAYRVYQRQQKKALTEQLVLECNAYGKPYIEGEEQFCFSLSHAGDYILLACDDADVGADIEQIRTGRKPLHMAKRFFTETEYEYLQRIQQEEERNREFIRIWTQKESYIKYLGVGLQYGMDSFYRKGDGMVIDARRKNDSVCILELTDIPGYCASVCCRMNKNTCVSDGFNVEDIPIEKLIRK